MAKRRVRKNTKQLQCNKSNGDEEVPIDNKDETFIFQEVERQGVAMRALQDVEIEQLQTMLCLCRSNFSEEQLVIPVKQFFKEKLPNLSISGTGEDGQYEVTWKDRDGGISLNYADERTVHTSLLHRLSMAYPDCSSGFHLGGFELSNKSVKTVPFAADKLQIRSFAFEEPSDLRGLELKDGLQTPNVASDRISIGTTPKTLRLPKCGEMLLSIRGSPLGVYMEDDMETIQEMEDD